jgi:hypothetical protein
MEDKKKFEKIFKFLKEGMIIIQNKNWNDGK